MTSCPMCGLAMPSSLPHKTIDDCQIALIAAQDAVQTVIKNITNEVERKKVTTEWMTKAQS